MSYQQVHCKVEVSAAARRLAAKPELNEGITLGVHTLEVIAQPVLVYKPHWLSIDQKACSVYST